MIGMGSYFATTQSSGLGALGQEGVAAPPGVTLPSNYPSDILANLMATLQVAQIGIFTHWAARKDNQSWDLVRQPPETNVLIFGLTDAGMQAATSMMFGQPIAFVAVLCDLNRATGLPALQDTEEAFAGTPYALYQSQAIYSQTDAGEPPTIKLLHWAKIRDQGDAAGGSGSMEAAARRLGGALVFAQQVEYGYTKRREPPATDFQTALDSQLGVQPVPGPGPSPQPGPSPTPEPGGGGGGGTAVQNKGKLMLYGVGAGIVAGAFGFFLMRTIRNRKRST